MKLEVAVTDVSQSRKDLAIEVSAEVVKAEFDKTYGKFARQIKLPGFRPGHVPLSVLKERFADDVKQDVVKRLIPHALQHALSDNKLRVVGKPSVSDFELNEGGPLKFKASVEVLPEFELKQYRGLKATKFVARITDEAVESVIARLRENAAEFVPIEDRPSQAGDFVSVNLVGKYLEPQEEEDLKVDDLPIELGAEGGPPEFSDNLLGVKAGDVREFKVAYPADFSSAGLAGKTVDFTATVVAVRKKELPELDDDFAQQYEYESLQQMREKFRKNLEREAEQDADARLRNDLLEQVAGDSEIEIPTSLIEEQAVGRAQEFAHYLLRNGMSQQSINEMKWDEHLNEARAQAEREIRLAMVVGRIGEAEGVTVTAQEIDAEIERIAVSRLVPVEQLKGRLTKDKALSSIENSLRYQKVLDIIVNSAEITLEELIEKQETENS